jgi:hypothetical protein
MFDAAKSPSLATLAGITQVALALHCALGRRLLLQVEDLMKHNEALSSQAHEFQNRCCAACSLPPLVTQPSIVTARELDYTPPRRPPLAPRVRIRSCALQSHVVTQFVQSLTCS